MLRKRLATGLTSGALAVALVAGCSSGGSTGDATSEAPSDATTTSDGGTSGGDVVNLDFWTWTTNMDQMVDLWNSEHPEIQVTVDSQAQGDEMITRLLTAFKAGNEPCVMHTEYQALPVLVANGVASDITEDFADVRDAFPEGAWGLTSFGGQAYAVPQDVAPMLLFYREDIFNELGLTVPTTWDEFKQVAQQVREKDPSKYLTTFSSGDPGWFAGLSEAAGANWWDTEGEAWKVSINDEATKKVAAYWGDLVNNGLVDDQPMYTPEWNAAMNDGTLIAWPSAIWGAGVLEGVAPDTQGKWRAVKLPQWNAGDDVTGYWGGSGTAISSNCKNRAEAVEFVKWLNSSDEAVEKLVTISGVYPAATAGQTGPWMDEPPMMMPNQPDYYSLGSEAAGVARGFAAWGPNVNVTYTTYNEAMADAITNHGDFAAAVDQMQAKSVDDLTQQGFELAE